MEERKLKFREDFSLLERILSCLSDEEKRYVRVIGSYLLEGEFHDIDFYVPNLFIGQKLIMAGSKENVRVHIIPRGKREIEMVPDNSVFKNDAYCYLPSKKKIIFSDIFVNSYELERNKFFLTSFNTPEVFKKQLEKKLSKGYTFKKK